MKGRAFWKALAALTLAAQAAQAASGAVLPRDVAAFPPEPTPKAAGPRVDGPTANEIWSAVGVELVKQRVLLAMLSLRVRFVRDDGDGWFLHLTNTRTGCQASRAVGAIAVVNDERARALAFEVTSLIRSSGCGALPAVAELPKAPGRLAPWVRPAGAVYAATSGLLLYGVSTTQPPNLSLSFTHAPSALISSGLIVGAAGGTATLFVPERTARPLLELTVMTSTSLQALAAARVPEPGVPAFGEYAVASGYALSSLLVGLDWALSPAASMLEAPAGATARDVPPRAISAYVVYAPALLGAVVSLARAFSPRMHGSDREYSLALGSYALLPAATGLVLGVLSSQRSTEKELPEPWLTGGPTGSFGLTLGSAF